MSNHEDRSRGRVFVLDDDEAVRDSVSQFLRLNDFDVRSFGSAEDFERAYDGAPGCLLLDIHLTVGHGLVLARDKIVGKLPLALIFMTGSIDPEEIEAASAIDSASVLRKPFASELLIADVERALGSSVRAEVGAVA